MYYIIIGSTIMINNDELLFVVDEHNFPLEPLARSFVHTNAIWHRTTGIWVINDKKQILCHKRSLKKDIKPGLWEAFFGGHLQPGEDYVDSAVKEIREELGITVLANTLLPYKILKSDKPNHKEFQHIFAHKTVLHDTDFNFEKEEIDELKWLNIEELTTLLLDNENEHWVHKPWDKNVMAWLMQV